MKTISNMNKMTNNKIPTNQKSYNDNVISKHNTKDICSVPSACKLHVYQISKYIDTDDVAVSVECVCTMGELLNHEDVRIRGIANVIQETAEIQSRIIQNMNALILEAIDHDNHVSHFVPVTNSNPYYIATAISELQQTYHMEESENIPIWIVHKSRDGEDE